MIQKCSIEANHIWSFSSFIYRFYYFSFYYIKGHLSNLHLYLLHFQRLHMLNLSIFKSFHWMVIQLLVIKEELIKVLLQLILKTVHIHGQELLYLQISLVFQVVIRRVLISPSMVYLTTLNIRVHVLDCMIIMIHYYKNLKQLLFLHIMDSIFSHLFIIYSTVIQQNPN